MQNQLRVRHGGSGEPVLLLLHGLGATSDVWNGWRSVLATEWPGRWLAPDLPGHGGSAPSPTYTFDGLASAVAEVVEDGSSTVVLGHSLGGVVGLALARRMPVRAVVGLGIKVEWAEDELQRAKALSAKPTAWFASRDEAAARHLKVSGLTGLLEADDPAVAAALIEQDGRWRLAMDPAAFGVGAPDMSALLAGSTASVVLARGEHDAMNTDEQLARLGVRTVTLPSVGHNAHVENPRATITLLEPYR